MLADDHVIVRAGFRLFLENDSEIQIVGEASNGKEACEFAAELLPDVAILDIQMPEMTGIEVTRWIRSKKLPVGVLMLSAYDDEPYIQAALKAGANGYVLKTADPLEIISAVKDVYLGRTVLNAALSQKLISGICSDYRHQSFDTLTEREAQIIALTARGFTNKAIALQLHISDRTVQNHLANIFQKLKAESRTEAVMRAVSLGLISANLEMTP